MPDNREVLPPSTPPPPPPPPQKSSNTGLWIGLAVGCGVGAILLVGLLIGLLLPAGGKVRENAKRTACKNNLRQIGIGLQLYADDNDGEFPSNQARLFGDTYVDNPRIFSCPTKPSNYMDFRTGSVGEGSSSYVYLPGRCTAMPGDFVLAYDKPGNHGGDGVNVLHIDSSVLWIRKTELPGLMQKIADQEAQLPELRRKLKESGAAGGGLPEPAKGPVLQGPALPPPPPPPKAPTAPEGW